MQPCRLQVTDTPGLLDRPDDERNAMERLTLAAMQHLPTAVLFVMDLTGECGTSVAAQWRIRCVALQELLHDVSSRCRSMQCWLALEHPC